MHSFQLFFNVSEVLYSTSLPVLRCSDLFPAECFPKRVQLLLLVSYLVLYSFTLHAIMMMF